MHSKVLTWRGRSETQSVRLCVCVFECNRAFRPGPYDSAKKHTRTCKQASGRPPQGRTFICQPLLCEPARRSPGAFMEHDGTAPKIMILKGSFINLIYGMGSVKVIHSAFPYPHSRGGRQLGSRCSSFCLAEFLLRGAFPAGACSTMIPADAY